MKTVLITGSQIFTSMQMKLDILLPQKWVKRGMRQLDESANEPYAMLNHPEMKQSNKLYSYEMMQQISVAV